MNTSKRLSLMIIVLCLAFPVLAKDYESKSSERTVKEQKRMAHKLRIPVEQLENAQSALQEATELAMTLEELPLSKISSIISDWSSLFPSKAESVNEDFVLTFQMLALQAADEKSYIEPTSSATTLLRNLASMNYQKAKEILSAWPYPLESLGENAVQAYDRMQSSVMQSIMQQMARKDPDALKEEAVNYEKASPTELLSIAQNLMNSGNRDKAKELLDKAIENLPANNNSPSNIAMAIPWALATRNMDNAQVEKLLDRMVPMMQQPQANGVNISTTLSKGDVEMQLSPSETGLLNILRGLTSRPRLLNKMLDKYPDLEAKFDSFGGIDDYLSNGSFASDSVRYQSNPVLGSMPLSAIVGYNPNDTQDLMDKLKDKAVDEPEWVKQELRKSIKNPTNVNLLTNIASNSGREYPELAEIALDLAEDILPKIEDLQRRFSALQSVISAYRNLDGEVREELFRKGFIILDQIREQEELFKAGVESSQPLPPGGLPRISGNTDRLEANLVADLGRQDYDKAIDYVDSMPPDTVKLECLIQISKALRQNNF